MPSNCQVLPNTTLVESSRHIHVRAQGRTFDLPPGGLLALDQDVPHDVEALEDSSLLLTIAWPDRSRKPAT
jgi:hypothetical protein